MVGDVTLWITSTKHAQGEIGFIVHPDHQRRGYAREAAAAVLRLGFDALELHRIVGRCEVRNEASAAMLRRARHALRGPPASRTSGSRTSGRASRCFAILRSEWDAAASRPRRA